MPCGRACVRFGQNGGRQERRSAAASCARTVVAMSVRRWRGAAGARWTLARQLLALQVALVLVAVAVAVTLSVWQVRRDVTEQAERRCLSIAQTIAAIGWVQQQLSDSSPT